MKTLFRKQKQSTPFFAKMQQISRLLLTTRNNSPYACHAFAKSRAECGNSNRYTANNSTPSTRAFFIRCSRTPKERYILACSSMVACSGQGLALDCVPCIAVFHPVTRYRPTLWKMLAIAPINFYTELSAMKPLFAYTFSCVLRNTDTYTPQTVRVIAHSETDARLQLTADYRLELNRPVAKVRLNPTAYTTQATQGGVYA
ncbi:host cell division inhibitor Icd-like protein [Ursidibacter sp. B-7004-1]